MSLTADCMRVRFLPRPAAAFAAAVLLGACGQPAATQQAPVPEVAVQTVGNEPLALELTYAARTAGSREVEVRARVDGILLQRRFEEGRRVRQGQSMFLIDPEPVRARLASAHAEVAVAQARLHEARLQKDRVVPLVEQNVVSESRRDEVVSAFEVAQANLAAAQSSLRMAQLDLEYTDVRAPISGLTSREMLSQGSLVKTDEDSSLLTKIVQIDPLYIEFSVPQAEAALIRATAARAGERAPGPSVRLLLEGDLEHPQSAAVTFIDNAVDLDSGTVRVRAVLPNAAGEILPGQFVRARVEGVVLAQVVLVPRRALMSGARGTYVWIVGAGEKVEMRLVRTGRSMRNGVVVTEGLAAGERYIVDGVLKVQPGVQVLAVPYAEPAQRAQLGAGRSGDAT
jgi:membrane fusion protein, multidrug efflux system